MDSPGNDITNMTQFANNVPVLQNTCSGDPRCVAFNTNGYLKGALLPQAQWARWSNDPRQGLYYTQVTNNNTSTITPPLAPPSTISGPQSEQILRQNNAPPSTAGFPTHPTPWSSVLYNFYPGKDSPGNDLLSLPQYADNAEFLANACAADINCAGFNTNGWLKNVIQNQSTWSNWTYDPVKGLYVMIPEMKIYNQLLLMLETKNEQLVQIVTSYFPPGQASAVIDNAINFARNNREMALTMAQQLGFAKDTAQRADVTRQIVQWIFNMARSNIDGPKGAQVSAKTRNATWWIILIISILAVAGALLLISYPTIQRKLAERKAAIAARQ